MLEPSQVPFNIVFDEQLKSIYLIFFSYSQSFMYDDKEEDKKELNRKNFVGYFGLDNRILWFREAKHFIQSEFLVNFSSFKESKV